MSDRPNLLFILTDQQSASALGCLGYPGLRTPAMDRLAAEGVRFDRAYCTYPLCTPSRGSLFSGLMPAQAGVTDNGKPLRDPVKEQGLGRLLAEAGYDCAYGGKWHVPEIAMPDGHGFRRIGGFDDVALPDACRAFLREKRDRPFFLVAGFDNPHNICEWARGEPLPWGPVGEPPPARECPNLPPNFRPPAYEPELIRLLQQSNDRLFPTRNWTADHWRRYRWAYARLVEKADAGMAAILEELEASGLAGNTVVVFSSDHGDGQGAHGWNQKHILYEEIVRVPLIVRDPAGGARGRVESRLVSNGLDLMPTLCDYAGIPVPPGRAGLSLKPLARGEEPAAWRDELGVETVLLSYGNGQARALVTLRYKYVAFSRGLDREQLFDLEADPGEMHNLAVEARHDGLLAEMRRRLAAWCERMEPEDGARFRVPGHEYGPDGRRR